MMPSAIPAPWPCLAYAMCGAAAAVSARAIAVTAPARLMKLMAGMTLLLFVRASTGAGRAVARASNTRSSRNTGDTNDGGASHSRARPADAIHVRAILGDDPSHTRR